MSDSVRPHRWQPTRLPRPWDSPGKNTGVGCHFLLQCMKEKSESEVAQRVQLLATPWTAAHQAPPSMGFSKQEYWSGVPSPSPNGMWNRHFSWRVARWLARYIFSITGCGHIFLQSNYTDLHTIMEEVWVSELAPAPGTRGTTKLDGQLSNPSLKTWCWSLCTTVMQMIKMQISSSHPSLSPSQFLSVNLHFKPGGLDGSKAGDLNLGFTGMLGQGPQTTVCRRVTEE